MRAVRHARLRATMAKVVFGSGEAGGDGWHLALDNPVETRTASRIEEGLPLLEFADERARAGAYVAVMIGYEAAAAFDSALSTHGPGGFPLAWAGVFANASNPMKPPDAVFVPSAWRPRVAQSEYDAAVSTIRELIAAATL